MAFDELRTERLLLRCPRPSDVATLHVRGNDPEVARYQDWLMPVALERIDAEIDRAMALGGPTPGRRWMITAADDADTTVLDDLVVHLDEHTAAVGYTFARSSWGHGDAAEALDALVIRRIGNAPGV